jgi:hypothetical protein
MQGQRRCATVKVPLGEPTNWISDDQLWEKLEFHAGDVYGEHLSRRIAAALLDAPLGTRVRALTGLLRLLHETTDPVRAGCR